MLNDHPSYFGGKTVTEIAIDEEMGYPTLYYKLGHATA